MGFERSASTVSTYGDIIRILLAVWIRLQISLPQVGITQIEQMRNKTVAPAFPSILTNHVGISIATTAPEESSSSKPNWIG